MEYVFKTPERVDSMNSPQIQNEIIKEIQNAIADGSEKIVIDMADTNYLSSAGIRVMTYCYKKIKAEGKSFVLRNVSANLQDLFDITGLSGYLPME